MQFGEACTISLLWYFVLTVHCAQVMLKAVRNQFQNLLRSCTVGRPCILARPLIPLKGTSQQLRSKSNPNSFHAQLMFSCSSVERPGPGSAQLKRCLQAASQKLMSLGAHHEHMRPTLFPKRLMRLRAPLAQLTRLDSFCVSQGFCLVGLWTRPSS